MLSMIRREPVGVVAAITPWNFPLLEVAYKLGPAVDSSGALTDGREFKDITDLRQHLLKDPDQIARNLTITYVSNVSSTQQQVIQVEYNVDRNVSIVGLRDQNGTFGIDIKIKKRFQ